MGRKGSSALLELPRISLDDVAPMSPGRARSELKRFCDLNKFGDEEREAAFSLFERSVATPGTPVILPTVEGTWHAQRTHDCMQAITDSTVASGLAERAFDAAPGSHFVHDLRDDACRLTNTCTNAPV